MGKQGRAIEATTYLLGTWMEDNNQCQTANLFEELEDLGVPQTEAISILHKAMTIAMDEQRRSYPDISLWFLEKGSKKVEKPKTKERVSIIVSGYEWDCPECKTGNTEISLAAIVRCEKCGEIYYTDDPDHAIA